MVLRKRLTPSKEKDQASAPFRNGLWEWAVFGLILAMGLGLRAGYLQVVRADPDFTSPRGDMAFHDFWARYLVTGRWEGPENRPNPHLESVPFFRPPGYPYFLALIYKIFGINYLATRVIQMTAGLLSCAVAFFFGRRLAGAAIGLMWAAFMAVYWLFLFFEGELNAPVILIFLFLVHGWLLWKWRLSLNWGWAAAAGIVTGIASLFSPNLLFVILAVPVWGAWVMRRQGCMKSFWAGATAFVVAAAGAIAPVTIRNYRVSGEWVLISCNGAITLYAGNNKLSDGVSSRIPESQQLTGEKDWGWLQYPILVEGVQREVGRPLRYTEVSDYFSTKAWDYIRSHPGQTLARMGRKILLFWGPYEITSNKEVQMEKYKTWITRLSPGFPAFLAPALIGVVILVTRRLRQGRESVRTAPPDESRWEMTVWLFAFVVLYCFSYLPFVVSSRFRAPIVPFVLLAAAYSLRCLGGYLRKREWRSAALWIVLGFCVFAVVSRPVSGYTPSQSSWRTNRGEAFFNRGLLEQALQEFQQAVRENPDDVRPQKHLAATLLGLGRFPDAQAAAEKALALAPDDAEIHGTLGLAMINTGKIDPGVRHLQEAVRLNPNYYLGWYNLGFYYHLQGDYPRAIEMFERVIQLRPDYPNSLRMLAALRIETGQPQLALPQALRLLQLQPDDVDALYLAAVAHHLLGDNGHAREELTRVLEKNPGHSDARELLDSLK